MKKLLKEIRDNNILLEVTGGELNIFAGTADIAPELIVQIKENKEHLIRWLLAHEQDDTSVGISIPPAAPADSYPLSCAQRRLWMLDQSQHLKGAYNMPGVYVLDGIVDKAALEYAFLRLIQRHESLRTLFREKDGQVRQFILLPAEVGFNLLYEDLSGVEPDMVQRKVREKVESPFDLAHGPLIRAMLYRVEDKKWIFAYVLHHIISDAWSMDVMISELFRSYIAHTRGGDVADKPLRIQYKDYACWEDRQMQGADMQRHKAYWLQQFEGELPSLDLPGDRPRPAIKTYNGGVVIRTLSGVMSSRLKQLCREQDATLFMGLLAAVNALFYRYTGQKDIIVGSSVAGRDHADLEDQIGLYLNTLALRTRLSGEDSFEKLLQQTRKMCLGAYEHQDYPLDQIIEDLQLRRDRSRSALFDVIVGLQNIRAAAGDQRLPDGITVSRYEGMDDGFNKFDLTLLFAEAGEQLQVSIGYNSDIFNRDTIRRLGCHLEQLLQMLLDNPTAAIDGLDYLTPKEREGLLTRFVPASVKVPHDKTVVHLFNEQAISSPQAVALVCGDRMLTYGQLLDKADRLAGYLREEGAVGKDDRVGILLDRNDNMIVAILAILKSGGAYVVIEPDYPRQRKEFIVADTGVKVLITQTEYLFDVDYFTGKLFAIDMQLDGLEPQERIAILPKPSDLAYVLYTSGSTGQPKGVMIEHRALVDYFFGLEQRVDIRSCKSFGLLSTPAADLGNTALFPALLTGAALHVFSSKEVMDPAVMAATQLDCVKIVPSHWKALQDGALRFMPRRCLIFGGEQLTGDVLSIIRAGVTDCLVYNHYGPSETTIGKLIKSIRPEEGSDSISLGTPFGNTAVYILDTNGWLCPIGIPGEICIAGDGVARGYLNLPELTDERFIPEPFGGKRKMYRTGDIGKWLPDGNIVFLGRKDQQVKIRGYRIETGEIEAALRSYPGMETAVVRAVGSDRDGKQLAAWYVHPSQIDVSRLKGFLAKALPVYMIPDYFVAVTEMPLTANGKVDIGRLPHPANDEDRSVDFIAPRTATEHQLAAIWSEILERKNIGISDNFFALGGHSLKVTRLASQIHRVFGANVEFHQLFDEASLESQAALIDRCLPEGGSLRHQSMTISPAPAMQDYPLSSSQRRLWILSQFEESNIAYNIPKVCRCTGKLDRQALEQAFLAMIARHEILRTAFRENKQGEIRQYILLPEQVHFSIGFTDVRVEDNALTAIKQRMETDAGQAFDLTAGCLLKAWLYQTQDNEWYFYYNMHHIISDGWSMGVFLEELLKLYAKHSGHDALLPGLACQYKDYAVWQQDQLHEGMLGQHRDYWLQQFEGEIPVLQLMTDKPRPAMKTYNGAVLSRMLNKRSVERLETLCRTSDATLFMGLLAAVNTLLHKYTGQKDIVVGSPIAGRQYADLDGQIGFYLNTLALRTRIGDGDDFLQLLKTVRQLTREAYEHQAWPFDELVKDLELQRDSSRSALFDVLIDLHRQTDYLPEKLPAIPDLEISAAEFGNRVISKFDLTFMFIVTERGLGLSVEYNTDLFNRATIQRLINHFEHMVGAVTDDPSRQLSRLDYLSEEEKQQVIASFNSLPAQYPKAGAVPALIAGQVEKCPDDMALSYGDIRTSYRQLEEEALRLAHYINIHHGIGKGSRVGVMMDRSDKMVVALLGIWKAGAAWVPIDPAYPPLRKKFLMDDASVALLITGSAYVFNLDYYQGPVVALDLQLDGMSGDPGWQEPAPDPDSLAYIIYTSGSTGMPKGCAITHASLFNYITWANKTYFGEEVKGDFGLFTSPAFDLTITSIFCTLTRGRHLRIYEQDRDLADVLTHTFGASSGIDSIKLTPSHINLLRQLELRSDSVRIAIVGGEALTLDHVMVLKRINPFITIYNEYGPTETTVGCVVHKQESKAPIFIGKPIDNTAIYILDALRQPCAIGIPGELYIGGAGLARGYWGRGELTAERFVDNPFRAGERMYRTGDWGRWDEEGRISFLGRQDDQVKIRGHRIELGEIEQALLGYPGVEGALVQARGVEGSGQPGMLVAWVTGQGWEESLLRSYLQQRLPTYMVPSRLVRLEAFPLTTNGKVDKRRLPDPEGGAGEGRLYVAPQTQEERVLAEVWSEVLRCARVGREDDFFQLGGDSIKSIQVVARVKQRGYKLAVRDILVYPILSQLATMMTVISRTIDQSLVEGVVELGPIQRWLLERGGEGVDHFNQSVLLYNGEGWLPEGLQASLDRLVLHHDALRMVFRRLEAGWEQYNKGSELRVELEEVEGVGAEVLREHGQRLQSTIVLERGPLLRACLFRGGRGEGDLLLVVIHHLVVDGVSWRILLEDLRVLYEQYRRGEALELPAKTDSFAAWMVRQQEYSRSGGLLKEEGYWRAVAEREISALPVDDVFGSRKMREVRSQHFVLERERTRALQTGCYRAYRTEINDVLVTGLWMALEGAWGVEGLRLQLEGHGREDIGGEVDVTRTVGWFTTVYPVVLSGGGKDWRDRLITVKESLHRVPNKGIGYGIWRYMKGMEQGCQPEVSFNYLGDFGGGVGGGLSAGEGSWVYSGAYHGEGISGEWEREVELSVTGMVVEGQLRLTVHYSGGRYREETIGRLVSRYREELEGLIERLGMEEREHVTPVDLSYGELSRWQVEELEKGGELEDVYPLSPLQEGLYYHWLSGGEGEAYFEQMSYRLSGRLDREQLERSYGALIGRHGMLRTRFSHEWGERVLQVVYKEGRKDFRYVRYAGEGVMEEDRRAWIAEQKEADRREGFKLESGSPMRLTVLEMGEGEYEFIWSHHHILMDGWCVGVLIREFFELYRSGVEGREASLGKVYPYGEYIRWLEGREEEASLGYWREYLSGYETVSGLPVRAGGRKSGYRLQKEQLVVGGRVREAIRRCCGEWGITENSFMQGVWGLLVSRYSQTEDVVFGTIVSGRPGELRGIEEMIGLFINTIPVRVRIREEGTVRELLEEVQREAIAGMPHHYTQLAQVQAQTPLGRNLFDHIFQFQNFPIQERIEKDLSAADASGKVSFLSTGAMGHNTYDLTLIVIPGDSMIFNFKYNGNVYEETLIRQLGAHLIHLINTILGHPAITVGELGLLSMEEQRHLLEQFSPGGGDYPEDQTVVRLFDKQAGFSPEALAVVSGGRHLTYLELKEQAGALAGYLHSVAGVNPGDRVGILLDRSEYWILSLMAVLKTGAAYVPIDPGNPASRKEFIVKDTDVKALITTTDYLFDVPGYAGTTVAIDIQLDEIVGAYATPMVDIGPETIAYIIYTSGSTGQPKGVMISHRSLVDYIAGIRARTNIESCRSFGLVSTPVADLGNTVLYTALLTGGVLHVFSAEEAMNGHRLAAADLDCVKIVPSHWKALQEGPNLFLPRRCLIFGGEQLNGELLSMIRTAGVHCEVYNHYGPTETTIGKLLTRVDTLDTGAVIPIGKPFCRSWVYITDNRGRLCPVGVPGEIRIGGDGVAQGYWNNHALTADRFLADPYRGTGRLYLTGDRGRWLPDGTVEFLGRIDDQVKIRGYRVEPGEIARKIMAIEGISSAVVIAMPGAGGEMELTAYVVSQYEIEESTFQEYLGRELPSYMWPRYYIRMPSIPLSANGKVDRRRLPAPGRQKDLPDEAYKAPRTETERRLSEIWSDVLGKERIGVIDNFFSLGGHSLKATRLASQIHRVFGVRVEFHELFNHTILEEQALLIDRARQDQFSGIPLAPPMDDYPLSSSQRRLWLLSQTEESNIAYNVPGLFVFEGELQVQALEQAFQGLVHRHEILRTAFRENASGEVRQIILSMEETGFRIDSIDLRMEDEKEAAVRRKVQQEMIRPFDLAAGCLLRVMLLQVDTDKWVFFYNLHHIISDGWSKSVVLNELLQFYNALAKNDPLLLRPLPIQYKDYAVWQQQQLSGASLEAHKGWWLGQFEGDIPILELPADKPRPAVRTYNGAVVTCQFPSGLSRQLQDYCLQRGGTLFMGLLAAVRVLLYRYTGQTDMVIGTPIAGRQHADLDDQIGFYVNTLALRTRLKEDESFDDVFHTVRETTLGAYEHQVYPFDALLDALHLQWDRSRQPLFDVMIVLQNTIRHQDLPEADPGTLRVSAYEGTQRVISLFDLRLDFKENESGIHLTLEYNTDIYERPRIERMAHHLERILQSALASPGTAIGRIDYLSGSERNLLLTAFNDTGRDFDRDLTLGEWFRQQARKTPEKTAIIFGRTTMSYGELDERSGRLACFLQQVAGAGKGSRIGVLQGRSPELLVSIIGVLRAGAAYIPLDGDYPEDRLAYMIADAGIDILLTTKELIHLANRLQWRSDGCRHLICVDSDDIYQEKGRANNELMHKELWDFVGEKAANAIAGGGWMSSYTGEDFSEEEMQEYADNVYLKLRDRLHRQMKVLEIGCSSGLTMFRLAPWVGSYLGTDLSSSILKKTRLLADEKGYTNISLHCLPAHDIHQLEEGNFDLIIFNSVVHCFEGHNYLKEVLQKAIAKLKPDGMIFMGDVMDEALRNDLVADMIAFQQAHAGAGYRTKTDWSKELFVSKDMLTDLVAGNIGLRSVTFSNKIHSIENELTRYRYDVLFEAGKAPASGAPRKKYQYDRRQINEIATGPVYDGGSESLAYVLYTSGSTGRPKGCMLEHRGVVNRLAWMAAEYDLDDKDVILQKTTFTFDVSVWELLLPLCKGGQLVLCEKDDAGSPERLLSLIATHEVSCLHFVPSMLNTFLAALADIDDLAIRLKSLRMVITSGEALAPELVKEWYRRLSLPIHNLYGPTEASIDVTHYTTRAGDSNIPIGRPIWNTRMYILDFLHQLQPLGIPGEIAIGGIGLAKGYLNNELLTAEKFIPDPFVPGERIYLTGDLGRWRQDGNIEYLGRKDTQVKIRGFRIETGEIENALRAHPSVNGAAVITTSATGGENELTAYVVSSEALSVAECRRHLAAILPEYMIPSHFVRLESLPLTTSGKLDRKKLPGAHGSAVDTGVPYEAPRNPTEEILVSIWQDVLGRQRIGIKDDFFALGGHSLLAVKVVTMANKALPSPIAIRNLFTYPTIDQLSRYIVEPELFRKEESKLIDLASESRVDIDLDAIHHLARHALPPQKILLTGATGFVGAYIMAALLRTTSATLFCLVRAKGGKTAGQRIMANLEAYGLGDPAFESRIVPVRGDLAAPGFGIDKGSYDELAQTVDHIYHVAAHMDLQSSYSQLKPANVGSVIELIRLASTARLKKLIYASTLAIFSGGREGIRYETDPIDGERHARAFGYSGSKWVAEKILLDAMARGLPAQVHRLGLICGDGSNGGMPEEQWFPRLLATCYVLGAFPRDFRAAITPVGFVAQALVRLSLEEDMTGKVFHLSNTRKLTLDGFFKDRAFQALDIKTWLEMVKERSRSSPLPITPLIDFNSGRVRSYMEGGSFLPQQENLDVSTQYTLGRLKELNIVFPDEAASIAAMASHFRHSNI